jgi:hypothetical protein
VGSPICSCQRDTGSCEVRIIEVGVEGDVVIDVYPCPGPLAHVERFGRQRSQCVAFERSEHTSTRSFALPGRSRRHAIVLRVRLALGE